MSDNNSQKPTFIPEEGETVKHSYVPPTSVYPPMPKPKPDKDSDKNE